MGGTNLLPVADLNRPTLLAGKGGGSMGILNNGPGILYVSNRPYFAWNDGYGVIPIPVGGTFAADGSQDLYGMPAPYTQSGISIAQSAAFGGSLTATLSKGTTQNNTLIVAIMAAQPTSGDVPSVTGVTLGGSAGTFAPAVTEVSPYSAAYFLASVWIYFGIPASQTALAISGINISTTYLYIAYWEFSGLFGGFVDKTAGAAGSSTSWSSGATATTTVANEAWIGCCCTAQTVTGPGTPWVNFNGTYYIGGSDIVSAKAAAAYAGTMSTANEYAAVVATIAPSQTILPGQAIPALVSTLSSSITAPP